MIANSLEYYIIDGISFILAKTTSYVTNRIKRVALFKLKEAIFIKPTHGTQTIKLLISTHDWLDPLLFRMVRIKACWSNW